MAPRISINLPPSPKAFLVGCLLLGSLPLATSPLAAEDLRGIAAQHEQTIADGVDPGAAICDARQQWQRHPRSLEATARLLVALDEPSLRKQHLDEVVAMADRLIARVKAAELDDEQRTAWLADALYRKGRALGYMELPDVLEVRKIKNPERHHERFESTFKQLDGLVDTTAPEYILLRIRRERRRSEFDEALRLLEIYRRTADDPSWYEKKRRAIREEAEAADSGAPPSP